MLISCPVPFTLFIVLILGHACAENAASNDGVFTSTFDTRNIADGKYVFKYIVPKHVVRMESRYLDQNGNYVVKGTYGYIDDLGKPVVVNYVADANGYRPSIVTAQKIKAVLTHRTPPAIIAALLG